MQCDALYDSSDDVVELTSQNFQKRVIGDDAIWIVGFLLLFIIYINFYKNNYQYQTNFDHKKAPI